MKEDKILKIYGFLHLWLFMTGILLLLLYLGDGLYAGTPVKIFCMLISAPVFREVSMRGKKIWSYLAVSFLILAGFWLLGKAGWERGCLLLGVLFFLTLFFVQRIKGNRKAFFKPSYPCLLVFALEYIFALEYGLEIFQNVFLVFAGCYWLLILWCRNREGFLEYCGDHEKLYRFPKQGIAYGNRLMLIFLTGLTVGCMVILPFLEIDRGILAVLELLRRFLAMLLSGEREAPEPEELPQEDMGAQPPFLGAGEEPSPLLTAIWEVLEKILIAAFVLAILGGICVFLYWLYRKYNSETEVNGDILESLDVSRKEKTEKLGKSRMPRLGFFWGRTPETRIRKSYRQKIMREGKPSPVFTPMELEEAAGLPEGEEREEFHSLYEKARYGNAPCSQEEARRMGELERVDFS